MSGTLVSCFLPVYNAERHLERWWQKNAPELRSVGAQVIVVDNGSTDQSLKMIESFSSISCEVIRHTRDLGLKESAKTAKTKITTKYRLWLSADDWLAPGYLAKALDVLERDPTISVVYGRSYMVSLDSGSVSERFRPHRKNGAYQESAFSPLLFNNYIPDMCLFRSSDLNQDSNDWRWFKPGNQASLIRGRLVFFTGDDQCFSGKSEGQLSKTWATNGEYFDYFENMFHGFRSSHNFSPSEKLFFYLVYQNLACGIGLLPMLNMILKNGHPYWRDAAKVNLQDVLSSIGLALVDELLLNPSELQFRKEGRLGSFQDLRGIQHSLTIPGRNSFISGLELRQCEGLVS